MSSQYGEDRVIRKYFGDHVGRFLDVGAFDGVKFSNTRQMADMGWSGVCIEPSPPAFCSLMRNYEGRASIDLVNAALMPDGTPLRFQCNTADGYAANMLSTFKDQYAEQATVTAGEKFWPVWIRPITWDDLLAMCPGPYDYVNIDVEGFNVEVLASMPFAAISPKMVCVEGDPESALPEMTKICARNGLTKSERVGGNLMAYL